MRGSMFVIALLAALLLGACSQTTSQDRMDTAPEALPPPPEPPTLPAETPTAPEAPAETAQATLLDDATDIFKGEAAESEGGQIADVRCNYERQKLIFTLHNLGEATWDLDQGVSFPPPQGEVNAKIFINNYEANGRPVYYDKETGDRLFGPSETFSENCGGEARVAPGESATCTLYPVALKPADDFANKNTMWISVPGKVETVVFTCA